jgi:hypothetical protein
MAENFHVEDTGVSKKIMAQRVDHDVANGVSSTISAVIMIKEGVEEAP